MRLKFQTVIVKWMDGQEECFESVTEALERDGQLHIFTQGGEMTPREHLASIPLVNIRQWKVASKW